MFDKMIVSILLYGSELLGSEILHINENLHLKYGNLLLKTPTPNFMIYSKLDIYPLGVNVEMRMFNIWIILLNVKE